MSGEVVGNSCEFGWCTTDHTDAHDWDGEGRFHWGAVIPFAVAPEPADDITWSRGDVLEVKRCVWSPTSGSDELRLVFESDAGLTSDEVRRVAWWMLDHATDMDSLDGLRP